jgi:hypothetical protein
MNYMSKESEKQYHEKQCEVYKVLIDAFSKLPETVKKFDGKVYNVKFDRALKELFTGTEINLWIDGNMQIVISYHRAYPSGDGHSCFYVEYDKQWSRVFVNAEKRIDSERTIAEIQATINQLHMSWNELSDTINNLVALQDDYEDICKSIKEFNKKYSATVRQNYRFDRVY